MKALIAIALALAPASANAPSLDKAIGYCRSVFVESIVTGKADSTKAKIATLETAEKAYTGDVCSAYFTGQEDLLTVMQKAGSADSGKTI